MWNRVRRHAPAQKRAVILHYHIFKNAGSTVISILKRNFGKRMAELESGHFNAIVDNCALLDFLNKHANIAAVSSHQLWPPAPEHEGFAFHTLLLLRHPIARLSSIYDFSRRTQVSEEPLTLEAKKRTTSDFMRLLIDEYPHHVNNPQVNYLSLRSRQSSESSLATAFRVARHATVLGITELFDLAAVQAEYLLAPVFEGLNFGYVAQNVSSMGPRDLDMHLAQFRDACGDQIYDSLLQANALDLELWQLVRQEVERRFKLIVDHEQRLQHFRFWCSILHPSSVRGVLASNHPHDFAHYANSGIS